MKKLDKKQQPCNSSYGRVWRTPQVCSKIPRAEIDDEYGIKLVEELGDVYCMLKLMTEHGVCTWTELEEQAKIKRRKLDKWSDITI